MIAARPLRFRNGRRPVAWQPHPPTVGGISGPARIRGGLLTKMSRRGDSETQRRFRGAISAGGGSLEFSLFTRRGGRRKTAPATAPQLRTYKTAPAPPGPRASVNISARDSWAERGWLPEWGAGRECGRQGLDISHRNRAFTFPRLVFPPSTGTDENGSKSTNPWIGKYGGTTGSFPSIIQADMESAIAVPQ